MQWHNLPERNKMIAASYKAGVKLRQIAAKYGLTYRTIYHILNQLGVKLRGWQD